MFYKNIKDIREDHDLTQEDIAKILECNRSTYSNWECGDCSIPLKYLDKLSVYYKTSFAYLLGLDNERLVTDIKKIDYDVLHNNLIYYKKKNNYSYSSLAKKLDISKYQCCYFHNNKNISVDILKDLSKIYNVNIDVFCGKK